MCFGATFLELFGSAHIINGLSHAKVAREGTTVHLFQEQLPEAMVGRDDKLENIQLGRAIQEGQAMHLHMQNSPSAEAAHARYCCKVASSY